MIHFSFVMHRFVIYSIVVISLFFAFVHKSKKKEYIDHGTFAVIIGIVSIVHWIPFTIYESIQEHYKRKQENEDIKQEILKAAQEGIDLGYLRGIDYW